MRKKRVVTKDYSYKQLIAEKEKDIAKKEEEIEFLRESNYVKAKRIAELTDESKMLRDQILKMFYTLRTTVPNSLFDYFVRKFTGMGGILVEKAEEKKPYILIDYRSSASNESY